VADTDTLIGQTVSHYRIIEKLVVAGWVWCTRLRTNDCTAMLLSSSCPKA
jgi:hypothetical protein